MEKVIDEHLDLDLLDSVLDALAKDLGVIDNFQSASDRTNNSEHNDSLMIHPDYHPEIELRQQIHLEFSTRFHTLIGKILRSANWKYIERDLMAQPVICIICLKQYCPHVTNTYDSRIQTINSSSIVYLWNDAILATYASEEIAITLESGYFN